MDHVFGPLVRDSATTFRLWAPSAKQASVIFPDRDPVPMRRVDAGFLEAEVPDCPAGETYKFRIGDLEFPDAASRWQDGDSSDWSVVSRALPPPASKAVTRPWHEALICEVHIGTASPEGTFAGLMQRLEHFRDAGYTALEIMPINTFPGSRNWGYDGTLIFAPASPYGSRESLRALVERAHELGIAMILDVVYNHFGSVDNFIQRYAPEFFDPKVDTPWGPGVDFTQPMVRQFYYENARMWLEDFDFDGLRFDSVNEIGTEARVIFLRELAQVIRSSKPDALLIIENMDNIASWLDRDEEDRPIHYSAQWNDDIHHVLNFLITGEAKGGYDDPSVDAIAALEKALADGFVHDGEADGESDEATRGEPASRLPPDAFVSFVQNHDQIGNRADGMRLPDRVGPEKLDFVRFVTMLAPQIPLFFMGEEGNLCSPFPFFFDLEEKVAEEKREDRYHQLNEIFEEDVQPGELPDPNDPETFESAKLRWLDYRKPEKLAGLERFRDLARFRREKVWPLAATTCLDATTVRQGNAVIINWTFAAGTLTMVLNASEQPSDIACVVTAAPVSTGSFSQQGEVLRLSGWSAVVWAALRD